MQQEEKSIGILIPKEKLSTDVLSALIEEFILREGTDYGVTELSLEQKKERVLKQLKMGHISILFDTKLETTTIVRKEELTKLRQQNFEILS